MKKTLFGALVVLNFPIIAKKTASILVHSSLHKHELQVLQNLSLSVNRKDPKALTITSYNSYIICHCSGPHYVAFFEVFWLLEVTNIPRRRICLLQNSNNLTRCNASRFITHVGNESSLFLIGECYRWPLPRLFWRIALFGCAFGSLLGLFTSL